ncbi:MFS transporter (plasmid) [Streptomyces sp. BB1-1-1]|uniref:MFS transporter n=1 Tax=Streptomyces sp. BB1-1-1 TaxID=3074430 RepID=UPI002877F6EC|nr:MFS transporter [Streptomyces sp. BB1-1-1]WND32848.1 MFS transporter [Streptomyces sp. BB1-1-1]WND40084.1 MFS transporter [Streptomyces sp. BB1-1-1]WND40918.1 MFS transporter [Streptomyces sp. BB1-1-1]
MRRVLGRDFGLRRFVVARALSRAGDAVFPIGLAAAMIQQDFGASDVGVVMGASLAPVVLLMPFGGVILDHFSARTPMVVADVVRAVFQGFLALLLLTGRPSLWQILVLSLGSGAAQAFFQPGVASMLRQLAPDRLRQSNATVRTVESVVSLAAPALAGVVIAVTDAAIVIVLDACTFAASAWLIARIRLKSSDPVEAPPKVWKELREGWDEFTARPWLWSVVSVFSLFGLVVFGPFDVLKAIVLIDRFGPSAYAWLISAFSLGAVIGGLLALWTAPVRPLRTGLLALLAFTPLPIVIGFDLSAALVAAAMVAGGAANAYWAVVWATSVQSHAPPHALSRIHAYDVIGSIGLMPAGRALTGAATALTGATTVLLISSAALLLGCTALLLVPSVRTLPAVQPPRERSDPAGPTADTQKARDT